MLLRTRPLVFLSSTITELADIRSEVKRQLDQLDIVDSWLFEYHRAASGATPDEQYLAYARTCDLYVVIVADQASPATQAEYEDAVRDNPEKVLPFFIGPDEGATADFRAALGQRHTFVRAGHPDELIEFVVAAIRHAVESGGLVQQGLRAALLESVSRSAALLNLALEFLPRVKLNDGESEGLLLDECLERFGRVLVIGEGGAGKSHGILVTLFRLTQASHKLPLYLTAHEGTRSIEELLESAFDSVRFYPGIDLINQYSREGRLLIGVDGYDELSAESRKRLLALVRGYADRYPRCSYLLAARYLDRSVLPTFTEASMAAISEGQLTDALKAHGYEQVQPRRDLKTELVDLVRRPFWLGALLKAGLSPRSPLAILQALISSRIVQSEPTESIKQVRTRRAAALLALTARPSDRVALPEALDALSVWARHDYIQDTFGQVAAVEYLEDVTASGLIVTNGGTVQFAHSLLAVVLAGEELVRRRDLSPSAVITDPELLPYVAALAADQFPSEMVEVLAASDVFLVARALRLLETRESRAYLESDAARYQKALSALRHLIGPGMPEDTEPEQIHVATDGVWLAISPSPSFEISVISEAEYEQWSNAVRAASDRLVVWTKNPFDDMTPESVAAAEIVLRFKEKLAGLRPSGDPYERADHTVVRRFLDGTTTRDQDIVDAMLTLRRYRSEVIEECGIHRSPYFYEPSGMPLIELFRHGNTARIRVIWGQDSADVRVAAGDGEQWYDDISDYLVADLRPREYRKLLSQVEHALGTPLTVTTWHQPRLVAGWTW